ncbi:MAG: protein translocase subunit SecD [Deltaproteobacteria bacterium]|nr:protein translocase subunit SecD [Deltaproteobacteria bacterium]
MTKELKWKAALIGIVAVVAFVYLLPTFANVPLWWQGTLPSEKIALGLDLQGGMHLLLEVDAAKAVENTVERYTAELEELLFEEGIAFDHVSKIASSKMQAQIVDAQKADAFQKLIERRFGSMSLTGPNRLDDGSLLYTLTIQDEEAVYIARMAVDQAIETIRNRIDQFGVSEPVIQKQGEDMILVQLPGVKDPQRAINLIGKTATLEFKLVDDENSLDSALKGDVPADRKILYQRQVNPSTGVVSQNPYLLHSRTLLTGDRLTSAQVRIDSRFNEPYVSIEFDSRGAQIFERITRTNVKKRLAIVLDDNVYSAPVIQERISGGQAQITGSFSMEEARDLAIVLRAGSLPAPVSIVEKRQVGPSLGRDSIDQGIRSILIGGALVIAFICIYYKLSGIVATLALTLNIVMIMAALAAFRATLTLPGIAGIVLTIGMAIDANVLIYERIREELRLGKTVRAAISAGYSRAMISILDSNLTTLLAAVFLFQFGTGPVKGFAVTLSIGILASLFTALFVSRFIFDYALATRRMQTLSI